MGDPSDRSRLISRVIGVASTAVLLAAYGVLLWSASSARQDLRRTTESVATLKASEQHLSKEIAGLTKERDSLTNEVTKLKKKVASRQKELSKAEETQRNLQLAAENAAPGEVQEQVLAAMRARTPKQRSDALYAAGKLARDQKQTARAEKLFEAAVGEYPSAQALNALGRLLADDRRLPEAEKLYLRAIKADPEYVFPLHNMSHLMMMRGRTNEAKSYAERALKVDPNYGPAREILKKLETVVPGTP
jgi:tetratricopeptide (TPR) repeat protein